MVRHCTRGSFKRGGARRTRGIHGEPSMARPGQGPAAARRPARSEQRTFIKLKTQAAGSIGPHHFATLGGPRGAGPGEARRGHVERRAMASAGPRVRGRTVASRAPRAPPVRSAGSAGSALRARRVKHRCGTRGMQSHARPCPPRGPCPARGPRGLPARPATLWHRSPLPPAARAGVARSGTGVRDGHAVLHNACKAHTQNYQFSS